MDAQDQARVLPAVAASNTQDALTRILQAMDSKWKTKPSENDFKLYDYAIKLRKEVYG